MAAKRNEAATDRRKFLLESATSVGALALGGVVAPSSAATSPAEQIRVGVVGLGSRGGSLVNWAQKLASTHGVQISAVCDLIESRREQTAERIAGQAGNRPATCRNIAELCDRKDVDAVLIATADFQHCWHAAIAVQAGKDVYVEKPFGCDFDQVKRAADTIRRSDRIVQLGTQSRGNARYYEAANLVQSGRLGQVTYIEVSEPIFQQRWRVAGAETALRPEEVDWNEFLAYLPATHEFNARHYTEFRLFWPFSSGPFCQWMSHRIDLVNLLLGRLPTSAVSMGGVYLWKDGRTNPDTIQTLLEYPGGVLVSYHMRMGNSNHGRGITVYGSSGTLELENGLAYGNGGSGLVIEADRRAGIQHYSIDRSRLLRARKEGGLPLPDGPSIDYLGHFFDCVRHRRRPLGDIEAAFGQSVATILANQAYRHDCKMVYDAERCEIRPAGSPTGSAWPSA